MGCREVTKGFLRTLAQIYTGPLINFAVTAIETLAAAGQGNPDVFTNPVKREAAFAAIKSKWAELGPAGVPAQDHLINLLLEYVLAVQKSKYDQSQLGVDDSATEPA